VEVQVYFQHVNASFVTWSTEGAIVVPEASHWASSRAVGFAAEIAHFSLHS
jgi:hypothetical protein